jgi:hypothetical protein
MMQSKLMARTHRTDMIRVPLLPAAASTRNSGVKRTTTVLKELHFATQAHPTRSTSHGIVRTAMIQTAKSPETDRIAVQSTTVFQGRLCGRLLTLRNLSHTKKARNGGETSDRRPRKLNMRLTLKEEINTWASRRRIKYIGMRENKATGFSSCKGRRWG